MIEFHSFGFSYPDSSVPALKGVTFELPKGALALVTGTSGVGKSTLLRATNGLVPHFTGGSVEGAVRVAGCNPVSGGPGAMSERVGFVSGDPESSFIVDEVEDEVAFALEHRGTGRAEMRARVADALARVGLVGLEGRRIATLSGGERQRVVIAAALALRPEVLVMDEPTSQLDDDAAAVVLEAVVELARDGDLTVLLSEHRLDRVLPHASHLVCLAGEGEEPVGGGDEAGERSGSGEVGAGRWELGAGSWELGAGSWGLGGRSDVESTLGHTSTQVLVGAPEWVLPHVVCHEAPAPPPAAPGPVVLELDGVAFGFGELPVLAGASLAVRAGEVVALMGPSGSGKTTLLRLIVGLIRSAEGEIRVEGESVAGRPVAEICRRVGYLPQDPGALLYADTVRQELEITLANHRLVPEGRCDPDRLLADLGIAALAGRYPRDLSTGQRQRAALGAIAVTNPAVLLLDEPTRGLDDAAIANLARLLHARAAAGVAILVATHDRRLTRAAHRVLRLDAGRVGLATARVDPAVWPLKGSWTVRPA